ALSIFFLVITVRLLLFRFFVRQVKTQRAMQELQPKIQAIRQRNKNDRQAMTKEIMALQQEAGVNPVAGCLPVILQAPVFLALVHVLRRIAPDRSALYSWTPEQMNSAASAKLFGAPFPAGFVTDHDRLAHLGGTPGAAKTVTLALIILMVATTYWTQRMVMS